MIYQHFRDDERPFIDRILEWQKRVEEQYKVVLSEFLDPREQDIIKTLIEHDPNIKMRFSGGYSSAERQRAILSPLYDDDENFSLAFLELNYPKKFVTIEHPSLLGSILGLGIKREKLGDFLFSGDRIQMVVAYEISDFLRMNLTKVGRNAVSCEAIDSSELTTPKIEWERNLGFVSSLRCDAMVAEAFRIPRTKASEFISGGKVKVNWKTVDKPSYELQEGDYLSVRHFGRARFNKLEGETKRGRYRVEYSLLK